MPKVRILPAPQTPNSGAEPDMVLAAALIEKLREMEAEGRSVAWASAGTVLAGLEAELRHWSGDQSINSELWLSYRIRQAQQFVSGVEGSTK